MAENLRESAMLLQVSSSKPPSPRAAVCFSARYPRQTPWPGGQPLRASSQSVFRSMKVRLLTYVERAAVPALAVLEDIHAQDFHQPKAGRARGSREPGHRRSRL